MLRVIITSIYYNMFFCCFFEQNLELVKVDDMSDIIIRQGHWEEINDGMFYGESLLFICAILYLFISFYSV